MNPWLPTAPCTPHDCAGHEGRMRGRPAAAALLLAGCACILAGTLGAPFAAMLGAARREWLIRRWAYGVVRAFGVRVRIVGTPELPDGTTGAPGTLVVANHISWLDIPLVAAVFPGRMLAKSEIRDWPLLGPLAARGGTLFVERDRLRALPATVRTIGAALRGGSHVVVFPEGTTWCGRGPGGRFGPAAFQAAIDADATVRPVRISYRAAPAEHDTPAGAAAFVGDDPLIASLWRVVTAAGLTAEIRFLPPIPARGPADRRALARRAQAAVANESANRPPESVHH
ncbi:lysophospholipid acyltransferase family protein [Streptomyces sp. JV185]|uniref:lysophospholipid acyltransferase family protein n=1 Tax=Streptomyces sp. JV185 TaxID=858638 RepID=UPI002E76DA47|nr:lysophospholipid acyltransferase family protein [Streptomyces sp. JV185]MEE1772280.1 lysophospholipid acyltransferase family protein [Streptomyces sp. JV185]